ncbi:hypothetical protein CANCADRAFT_140957 [Tortispora caseinolytica NRRL Y-17796]|uniref:PWWP domain-containing protein n=1 Tax=Tortispora caseinolytica NRRL Y-17796 TaxID=767744 RepID=A0A1E4TD50_9ASCO|nr:hypothetical protein CANCADRAFT_140957 [Tortispora caseinolytica NRRL Y-17796]
MTASPAPSPPAMSPERSPAASPEVTAKLEDTTASKFKPGDVVLGKVKGYPAWPAMVVAEEQVPPDVMGQKPLKRRPEFPEVWPVRFFVELSYMWGTESELQLLTPEQCKKFLSTRRKDKGLIAAYKQAMNPPDPLSFGSVEVAAPADEDDDEEDEEDDGNYNADANVKDSDDESKQPEPKRKVGRPPGKRANKKSASSTRESTPVKKQKMAAALRPYEERYTHVLFLRHKLQKAFLTKDKTPDAAEMPAISDFLSKLEHFQGLELPIIKQTKVNRVLKGILKLESIPMDDSFKFKERARNLLEAWSAQFDNQSNGTSTEQTEPPSIPSTTAPPVSSESAEPVGPSETPTQTDPEPADTSS